MRVLIYKPSKQWKNCGGLLVYAINELSQPPFKIELVDYGEIHYLYLKESDVPITPLNDISSYRHTSNWVLDTSFTSPDVQEGIIAFDYNYA